MQSATATPKKIAPIRIVILVNIVLLAERVEALGNVAATLTDYIRGLRGSSSPCVARASDGQFYVVKFAKDMLSRNLPFNESVGTEIYRSLGMNTPRWRPLIANKGFLEKVKEASSGGGNGDFASDHELCFGSTYIGCQNDRLLQILPGTCFSKVQEPEQFWLSWAVDICADHTDNRQALFLEGANGSLKTYFIDHGCMLGGADGAKYPHFLASEYLDERIYPKLDFRQASAFQMTLRELDVDLIWRKALSLPEEWITKSALSRLGICLNRLTNREVLESIVSMFLEFKGRGQFARGIARPRTAANKHSLLRA